MLPDDMPPEWMWPLPDELEEWFTEVQRRRDERLGRERHELVDAPDMMQNELTRGRRG